MVGPLTTALSLLPLYPFPTSLIPVAPRRGAHVRDAVVGPLAAARLDAL